MQPFLGEDFLLNTNTARKLYHGVAADLPIVDYHNHLDPKAIASDQLWSDIGAIWLEGDHYKWRAMRWAGVQEEYITGSAGFREKFNAFARTIPQCIGNPLYHWTHLELQRYFDISEQLSPDSADTIWNKANERLQQKDGGARGLLEKMKVVFVGTTDDPCDTLEHHRSISEDLNCNIAVAPSFRPDSAFKIELAGFPDYVRKLEITCDKSINSYHDLISVLSERVDYFVQHGCKAADHGIDLLRFELPLSERKLDSILQKRLSGKPLEEDEIAEFQTAVLCDLAKIYKKHDMIMQLHIGAIRNNRSKLYKHLGLDTGGDSIGDVSIAAPLNALLDLMDVSNNLPRTILYCLDPTKNEVLVTTAGNFQDGTSPGKIQAGSGWWFNDQLDGMERQMTQLAQMGLLSHFIGMLTDSRSFLSFPRHEYFRRLLCRMIGGWVEDGQAPNDEVLLEKMVRDICYQNAANWFVQE